VTELYTHDAYLSNVLPEAYRQSARGTLEAVTAGQRERGFSFPDAHLFQTLGELRESIAATSIRRYFLVSLSTRFRTIGRSVEYLFPEGWCRVAGSEAEQFFSRTNLALLESDLSMRPAGELWYAMVCGHFPQCLIEELKKYRRQFHGVKVGSARPIPLADVRYAPLWKWCADEGVPVLLHCSGESAADFLDGVQICRAYPALSVTLSHLGGMRQHDRAHNERTLLGRAAELKVNGMPPNLTLNNAVCDIELTDYLLDAAPELESRILNALDLPFFGTIQESIRRLSQCRASVAITQNTTRFLSG
jgi:hypothetical protein